MAANFPPDFFAPGYFSPDYFGGETDPNALLATIVGTSTLTADLTSTGGTNDLTATIVCTSSMTATISVAPTVPVEEDDTSSGVRRLAESEAAEQEVKRAERKRKTRAQRRAAREERARVEDGLRLAAAKATQDKRNQQAIQMLLAMIDVIDDDREERQAMQATVMLADLLEEVD